MEDAELEAAEQKKEINLAFQEGRAFEQRKRSWVSVKDRLPEYHVDVLWWDSYRGECIVGSYEYYDGKHIQATLGDFGGRIAMDLYTHWMPLPKPPSEDTQEA